jgi:hypothetical protein
MKTARKCDYPDDGGYPYDLAGRLQSVASGAAASATVPAYYINAITYNARGQTTQINYADYTIQQAYSYDANRGWLNNTYMPMPAMIRSTRVMPMGIALTYV